MTDAEKELRRLAEGARQVAAYGGDELRWHHFREAAQPAVVIALLDRIEALEADNAAMVAELQALDARRDEAVEWIGVVREELVLAGGEGGDRNVALENLRALVKKQTALTTAAQRASAELRHALRFRDAKGCVDVNLVSRAVVLLEEATTPGRPEKTR